MSQRFELCVVVTCENEGSNSNSVQNQSLSDWVTETLQIFSGCSVGAKFCISCLCIMIIVPTLVSKNWCNINLFSAEQRAVKNCCCSSSAFQQIFKERLPITLNLLFCIHLKRFKHLKLYIKSFFDITLTFQTISTIIRGTQTKKNRQSSNLVNTPLHFLFL